MAADASPSSPAFEPNALAVRTMLDPGGDRGTGAGARRDRGSDSERSIDDEQRDRDLGFGTVVSRQARQRLVNRDGSLNVVRSGLGFFESVVPYHHLLTMSWPTFLGLVIAVYFLVNLLFAALYVLAGPAALAGAGADMLGGRFSQAFYFSVQTFATIGYGQIGPNGFAANFLVTIEALVGLMYQALATGLLFARFSRPPVSITFSRAAVIAPYNNGRAFEFRVANRRRTQVINLEAQVIFSWMADDERIGRVRRYRPLPLERQQVTFFPLAWTVVHPIDEASPLASATPHSLRNTQAEVLIVLSGTDETSGQAVHARNSYVADEIVWNAKFQSIYPVGSAPGTLVGDISRLHDIEHLDAAATGRQPAAGV